MPIMTGAAGGQVRTVDPEAARKLQALLDGPHAALREQTRGQLCEFGLEQADGLPRGAYRDLRPRRERSSCPPASAGDVR
jgi:hypothetical protein